MDTLRGRAAATTEAGGWGYDAFISYAHDSDGELSTRLQRAVQRFAKPWWKRQSLRLFRDDASLGANPHLWGSIAAAMDDSARLVVLLSPEAAASRWVDREVEYWLEHREPERIIPVLTRGSFAWAGTDFQSDAAPPALQGAFREEPRWVDLRDDRLEDGVADIAAALHGVAKDELVSEELRQHRRTIRIAVAAGVILLLTAIAAAAAAVYAIGQRNEATAFAREMVDFARQLESSDAAPPGSSYVRADVRGYPLPLADAPPQTPRLDFLTDTCVSGLPCFRRAIMRHPDEPLSALVWVAYEPFHIRHGFINESADPLLPESLRRTYDVEVFVTRREGPPLDDGAFEIGTTYRFTSDALVRVTTDRCGPGYRTQSEVLPCDQFVHEFAHGLPPGLYDFWVEWQAPCSAWTSEALCDLPDESLTLFTSSARLPFFHETFTESRLEEMFGEYDPDGEVWTSEDALLLP